MPDCQCVSMATGPLPGRSKIHGETNYSLSGLIDLDRYPLDRPDSNRYRRAVDHVRSGLRSVGCAIIKNMVRVDAVEVLSQEINDRKHTTHYSTQSINPYFHTEPKSDFPERL